jgi:phage-related minor tail protein
MKYKTRTAAPEIKEGFDHIASVINELNSHSSKASEGYVSSMKKMRFTLQKTRITIKEFEKKLKAKIKENQYQK